jgi:predicted RNA binding protein with dsRBD fold (UPF0201 family)
MTHAQRIVRTTCESAEAGRRLEPRLENLLKRKIIQNSEEGELDLKVLVFETRVQLETYREKLEEADTQGSAQSNLMKAMR